MVYVDTSVVLAHLLAEDTAPSPGLWDESLVASRLVEFETLCRLHATGRSGTHEGAAREILARIAMLELVEPVVARVTLPFPEPVRTLDALHLASMAFLEEQGVELRLATYDRRLSAAARALGMKQYEL